MQKFKLFLGAALVATSWSASTVASSATTLERGNFSAYKVKRKWERNELRDGHTRQRVRENGNGFFDSLFRFQRRRWFDDGSVLPVQSNPKPEFYTYKPEPEVALKSASLKGEVSEMPYARWVFDTLREGSEPTLRTQPAEKKAIMAFYKERKFEPLWVGEYGLNLRSKRLIDALSKAADDGLMVSNYLPPVLVSFNDISEDLFEDPEAVADLELGLTTMALKFARHASGGQVQPNKIGRSFDLKPPTESPSVILAELSGTLHPEEYLDNLHPTHPLYVKMKEMLAKERDTDDGTRPEPIPRGGIIRLGSINHRVPMIRTRMKKMGFYYDAGDADADPYVFDEAMMDAVKEFQAAKGVKRDGIVGNRTIARLNGNRPVKLAEKLQLNMERMRWFIRSFGERHVIVNQAAYQAQIIDNDEKIHQMRVIIGKPEHPTPLFSDEMETVVFNPYWNVPRSIMTNEYLPRLINDPGYLDRKGFEVRNARGQQVSSYLIDWWNLAGRNIPYDVRQPPGRGNALGEIKFLFPNKHAVYMHDTPKRGLFANSARAYSHGCVRVQNPRKFAQVILGWSAGKVSGAVETGENRPVTLKQKIPVHMTYFTLWPDDSGRLISRSDVYKRDSALKKALKITQAALNYQVRFNLANHHN